MRRHFAFVIATAAYAAVATSQTALPPPKAPPPGTPKVVSGNGRTMTVTIGRAGGPIDMSRYRPRRGGREALSKTAPRLAASVDRGLARLGKAQHAAGFWSIDEAGERPSIACTSLALLAFMSDGSTLRSGPYRAQLRRGVAWLREQQDPDTGKFGLEPHPLDLYD